MRALALIVLLVPSLGRADPEPWFDSEPWIDYELVMSQHTDEVVATTDDSGQLVRLLSLPGQIEVSCRGPVGQADCWGSDLSGQGGVGCALVVVATLDAMAKTCPGFASEVEGQRLDKTARSIAVFVMENTVPARPVNELDQFLLEISQEARQGCAIPNDVRELKTDVVADETWSQVEEELEQMLAVPRLPVGGDCF